MCNSAMIAHVDRNHGSTGETIRFTAKLHAHILLCMSNWRRHIKARHPEMTLGALADILAEPDRVFKPSKNSKEFYYQRAMSDTEYRVVVGHDGKNTKAVITAYAINRAGHYHWHEVYCCYEKPDADAQTERKKWREAFTAEYELILSAHETYA